jgi:hypothetical protein
VGPWGGPCPCGGGGAARGGGPGPPPPPPPPRRMFSDHYSHPSFTGTGMPTNSIKAHQSPLHENPSSHSRTVTRTETDGQCTQWAQCPSGGLVDAVKAMKPREVS